MKVWLLANMNFEISIIISLLATRCQYNRLIRLCKTYCFLAYCVRFCPHCIWKGMPKGHSLSDEWDPMDAFNVCTKSIADPHAQHKTITGEGQWILWIACRLWHRTTLEKQSSRSPLVFTKAPNGRDGLGCRELPGSYPKGGHPWQQLMPRRGTREKKRRVVRQSEGQARRSSSVVERQTKGKG